MTNFFKKGHILGGVKHLLASKICDLGGSRTLSLVLGGVCDLCTETRGGQYFAAEGREIEGPPP